MEFYVSAIEGAGYSYDRCCTRLKELGHSVILEPLLQGGEGRKRAKVDNALLRFESIEKADAVIVLTPWGPNCTTDLGVALGLKKPVLAIPSSYGKSSKAVFKRTYYFHPLVTLGNDSHGPDLEKWLAETFPQSP